MKVESLILSVCSALLWVLGGLETINIYLYRTATVFIILRLYLRHCVHKFINYPYYLYVKALGVEDQKSWYRWYATGILCQTSFSDMFYKEYLIVSQNVICSLSLIFFHYSIVLINTIIFGHACRRIEEITPILPFSRMNCFQYLFQHLCISM